MIAGIALSALAFDPPPPVPDEVPRALAACADAAPGACAAAAALARQYGAWGLASRLEGGGSTFEVDPPPVPPDAITVRGRLRDPSGWPRTDPYVIIDKGWYPLRADGSFVATGPTPGGARIEVGGDDIRTMLPAYDVDLGDLLGPAVPLDRRFASIPGLSAAVTACADGDAAACRSLPTWPGVVPLDFARAAERWSCGVLFDCPPPELEAPPGLAVLGDVQLRRHLPRDPGGRTPKVEGLALDEAGIHAWGRWGEGGPVFVVTIDPADPAHPVVRTWQSRPVLSASRFGALAVARRDGRDVLAVYGPRPAQIEAPSAVHEALWTPDGRVVALVDGAVLLWSPSTGRVRRFEAPGAVAIGFDRDGRRVGVLCGDGRVRVLDAARAAQIAILTVVDGKFAATPGIWRVMLVEDRALVVPDWLWEGSSVFVASPGVVSNRLDTLWESVRVTPALDPQTGTIWTATWGRLTPHPGEDAAGVWLPFAPRGDRGDPDDNVLAAVAAGSGVVAVASREGRVFWFGAESLEARPDPRPWTSPPIDPEPPTRRVDVRVVDPAGWPVPGVAVSDGPQVWEGRADLAGRLQLRLSPGVHELRAKGASAPTPVEVGDADLSVELVVAGRFGWGAESARPPTCVWSRVQWAGEVHLAEYGIDVAAQASEVAPIDGALAVKVRLYGREVVGTAAPRVVAVRAHTGPDGEVAFEAGAELELVGPVGPGVRVRTPDGATADVGCSAMTPVLPRTKPEPPLARLDRRNLPARLTCENKPYYYLVRDGVRTELGPSLSATILLAPEPSTDPARARRLAPEFSSPRVLGTGAWIEVETWDADCVER